MKLIGEIEILRTRIYSLDPDCGCPNSTSVVVEPGRFPLYSDGLSTFWVMDGRLNLRGVRRMGDGMFSMIASDTPSDVEVTFPSRTFGHDEWAELLAEPTFTEGDPEQRIRVHLSDAAVSA